MINQKSVLYIILRGGEILVYKLEGLDCPNCAAKLERELRKIEGLSEVSVNFNTKSIAMDPRYEGAVVETLKSVEPDVELVPEGWDKKEESKAMTGEQTKRLIYIFVSAAFLLLGITAGPRLQGRLEFVRYVIFFVAYIAVGWKVVYAALRNIARGEVFDENFLMTVATAGAIAIRELPEAVGVMLFYSVGEYFQALAVDRSRRSIEALMDIRPDYANLKLDGGIERVAPQKVNIDQIIVIRPGEKIPLDGKVISGTSFMDTSALTGESVPRKVEPGEKVLSGMVNTQGLLEVKVEKTFGESSVSKILDLVQNAASKKARTEQFITKFARYYTPAVVFSAAAIAVIPPLAIPGASFSDWLYRALTMLVISCPCALVVSIPLGYFGGIGGASRRGILVKGANFLEALTGMDTVVFDKTGTLTKGVFCVSDIKAKNGFSTPDLLRFAAMAEAYSNHPIAKSIREAYAEMAETGNETSIIPHKNSYADDPALVETAAAGMEDYKEIAGHGVMAVVEGKTILAGNERLMEKQGIIPDKPQTSGTAVHVAVDGIYAGLITISDEIKSEAKEAIKQLKAMGVRHTVMLTGDEEETAKRVAGEIGIDEYYAGLLPQDKVEKLEQIRAGEGGRHRRVAFAGDGINDAPVITRADVGIAMGGLASDAAIEASDVVIMEDAPSKVAEAISIARYTKKIVYQNIILALGIKGIFLVMGALGAASMWEAVFADVGVALLAVLNSIRTLTVPELLKA